MNSIKRLSILIAVVVIAGLLAGTWFVAISPRLAEARAADDERETVETQNAIHETTLKGLMELADREEELEADLELVRASIPDDIELSAILRRLDAVAEATGTIIKVTGLEGPTRYAPLEAAAETAEASGPSADPEYADALGSVTPENFFTIALTFEIIGDHLQMLAAVEQLQLSERLTLVGDVKYKAGESTVVTGQMFVLLDAGTVIPVATTGSPAGTPAESDGPAPE
ncbi:hypothetical protein [Salinibacterium sp. GXW1014]|uniref:hypothetical protein n=1 Tax=Salinibacterium sp. GXW1014 TaxID=3377838 RepID=UPI00383BCF34